MTTILDYLDWRGDLSFDEAPFNEIDNLILAELAYPDYAGIVPSALNESISLSEVARRYFIIHPERKNALGVLVPEEILDLLEKAAQSRRFCDVQLSAYVNDIAEAEEKQFSATTFTLNEHLRYVSFRGTDDTLVGWKENFNMCFTFPVPAQRSAAAYLDLIARAAPQYKLICGGHSKGGNLAVYAATYCAPPTQDRLLGIYNNDGPGFNHSQQQLEHYQRVRDRITTLMPSSSVVGILLEHEEDYRVVTSKFNGIHQHDGMSWQVLGTHFIYADKLESSSEHKDKTLHAWIEAMPMAEREQFVNKLFALRENIEATTLTQLIKNPRATWDAIQKVFDDPESSAVLKRSLGVLFKENTELRMQSVTDSIAKVLPLREGKEQKENKDKKEKPKKDKSKKNLPKLLR